MILKMKGLRFLLIFSFLMAFFGARGNEKPRVTHPMLGLGAATISAMLAVILEYTNTYVDDWGYNVTLGKFIVKSGLHLGALLTMGTSVVFAGGSFISTLRLYLGLAKLRKMDSY